MKLEDWETISNADSEKSAYHSIAEPEQLTHVYERMEIIVPRRPDQPPRLKIAAATWGGVNVTEDIRSMISASETLALDMHSIHRVLVPDPMFGTVKTLAILYQYEDEEDVHLLNTTEHVDPIILFPKAHEHGPETLITVERPWRAGPSRPYSSVEIIAVLYGPKRIETPSVLEELTKFFEGRRGQIRMTNAFFKADTWPGRKKSWTVFFRFTGSKAGAGRIQCVTGLEDGALEVPWGRD